MGQESKKVVRKLGQVNPRGVFAGFLLLFILTIVGYYIYLTREYSRLGDVLIEKEKILKEKEAKYKSLIDNVWIKKYQASKVLYADKDFIEWKKTIIYLIEMLKKIKSIDKNTSGVTLDDFQVSIDGEVHMKGTIGQISGMYVRGGVLDQFIDFDFIEQLDIPSYSESKNIPGSFDFVLNATVKSHE